MSSISLITQEVFFACFFTKMPYNPPEITQIMGIESNDRERSISRRVARGLSFMKTVLTSDVREIRSAVNRVLETVEEEQESQDLVSQQDPRHVEGVLDARLLYEQEISKTPMSSAHMLPIPEDARMEPRSLSQAYEEVLRRMGQIVFVPRTHPIFAFFQEVFGRIRFRQDFIEKGMTFDEIFRHQLRWYEEQVLGEDRRLLSPTLAFHWRCYFRSGRQDRYEENLFKHSDPEIQLYADLMRSCFRVFDELVKERFPTISPELREATSLDLGQQEDASVEPPMLRGAMAMASASQLIRPYGLPDFFPEDVDPDMEEDLDAFLPRGAGGEWLFDTNIFVAVQIARFRESSQKPTLRDVLSYLDLEKYLSERFGVSGFLQLPESRTHLSVKNVALWKEIRDPRSVAEEDESMDYEAVYVDREDLDFLAQQLGKAFRERSNIHEVIYELFPDMDQTVLASRDFFSDRFKKIAALARDLMGDDPHGQELVKAFFGVLSSKNWKIWNQKVKRLGTTPFRHLKRHAEELEREEEAVSNFNTRWNFLGKDAEKVWNPESPRFYGRVGRLSGYRKKQRDVRSKLIRQAFERMYCPIEDYAVALEDGQTWWQLMHALQSSSDSKRHLVLAFLMPDGKVMVCQFPLFQR